MAAPLIVISPHLDDAVFGCAGLIAAHPGALVVTVFAGMPPAVQPLTGWDRDCGFGSSQQAMHARRREDRAALAWLRARPHWLRFLDAQYDRSCPAAAISTALEHVMRPHAGATTVFPLGLFHSDHKLVSAAALTLVSPDRRWLLFTDALYRSIDGAVEQRLAELAAAGFRCETWACPAANRARKAAAVACYRSQLRGLATDGRPGHGDLAAPERYWRLQP